MMDSYGWGGWFFGAVLMVGFWVLIFWLVVSVVHRPESGSTTTPTRLTAEEILRERFARGEIDAEEYGRRRDALTRTELTNVR